MLKLLVNDINLWNAFKEEIEGRISQHQKNIEQFSDVNKIFEEKGSIRELRDLLKLRDKLNGGS
jgi:hypothetical protein